MNHCCCECRRNADRCKRLMGPGTIHKPGDQWGCNFKPHRECGGCGRGGALGGALELVGFRSCVTGSRMQRSPNARLSHNVASLASTLRQILPNFLVLLLKSRIHNTQCHTQFFLSFSHLAQPVSHKASASGSLLRPSHLLRG